MILKADDRQLATLNIDVNCDIADQASRPSDRIGIKDADTRHPHSINTRIPVSGELIATAHRQHHSAVCHDRPQMVSLCGGKIRCNQQLVAVLTTTEIIKVGVERQRLTEPTFVDLNLMAAPFKPPFEYRDVAAISIDIELFRVEVTYPNTTHACTLQR